jgi:chromosome segregation ATPase
MPDDSTIPDEAVKAATKAIKLLPYGTYYKDVARAALTAAYPHLVAELDHVAWQRDDFRIAWNDVAKIVEQRNHQLDEAEHEVTRLRAQVEEAVEAASRMSADLDDEIERAAALDEEITRLRAQVEALEKELAIANRIISPPGWHAALDEEET